MNDRREIAQRYHHQTKHHFDRQARSLGYLDWATQPNPFRRFEGAPFFPLRFCNTNDSPNYDEVFIPGRVPSRAVDLDGISTFFQFSLALSAWKQFRGDRWALRINPSSGNLHPTEGYALIGPTAGLSDAAGVFHYAPKEHGFERRTSFALPVWNELLEGFPARTFLVGLTSIHWREAWKYGERAYRYCQHDVGHAIATLSISAAMHGWRTIPLNDLGDAAVASLLGLDRAEDFQGAEPEHSDLLLAVIPTVFPPTLEGMGHSRLPDSTIAKIAAGTWSGTANRLSSDHVEWPVIDEIAEACKKSETGAPSLPGMADVLKRTPNPSPTPGRGGAPSDTPIVRPQLHARQIIFQRRSAVAFDGQTSITAEQLYLMLSRVMPRFDRAPWSAISAPVCLHLAIFVHRVVDLDPGLYVLVRDPDQLVKLKCAMNPQFAWATPNGCWEQLPLYMLAAGDTRALATTLSCHQDIGGDSAFSLAMIAEFDEPLGKHGAWFYRRLFWEAGMIGQVLYLEAEAAGVRGTGIGCFFDDPVHRLLGLSKTAYQSLYHFTIGGPVEDTRLTTLPPYPRNT